MIHYYALGGGHGHALRGLAMLQELGSGTLIAPDRLSAWSESLGITRVAAPPLETPELLIVDTFPRGVTAELVPWLGRCPAWLVSRWVRPDYYLKTEVREIIEARYERLIWCEAPPAPLRDLSVPQWNVSPLLLQTSFLPRRAARERLGVPTASRLILALGSGPTERQQSLCRLLLKIASRLGCELRFLSDELAPEPPVFRMFPAAPALRAGDAIVSAAGYHAFHEISASGVPAVYVPQTRLYDDQRLRASGRPTASSPWELALLIKKALTQKPASPAAGRPGAGELAAMARERLTRPSDRQPAGAPRLASLRL